MQDGAFYVITVFMCLDFKSCYEKDLLLMSNV